MKIKGISFFEQHVEKFVAGGAGLVLVGVVALQFLTSPNHVPMADGKEVGPSEIEPRLKQKAEAIRARLSDSASATLVDGPLPKAFDDFKAALDGGVSPRRELPATEPALLATLQPGDVSPGEKPYHVPSLAAPVMAGVRQESDTLEPTVVQQNKILAERFAGGGAPYDIMWAVPVANVNLKAMREEYRKSSPTAKPQILALPPIWFNDSLFVVDVIFERQEQRADGSWGEVKTVAILPSHYSFRPQIPTADAGLKEAVFNELSQPSKVREVLQPEFLPTKGDTFSASLMLGTPTADPAGASTGGDSEDVRRLKRESARLTNQVAQTEADLKERGGPLDPESSDDKRDRERKDREEKDREKSKDRGGSGGGGGGGGGGVAPPGGGGFGSGTGGPGKNKDLGNEADKQKRIALTKKLRALQEKLARINAELAKIAPNAAIQSAAKVNLLDLSKDDSVLVWAHDIDVQSGATYRYRCHLEAFNPFFARKRQLVKEQQSLADAFVLKTKDSEWSDPVNMQPPVAFFVADAAVGDGRLGLGQARVDLYRFYDGQRRAETFTVQPGDRIGGTPERTRSGVPSVDYTTDWFVVDIVEDAAAERGDRRGAQVVVRRIGDSAMAVRSPRDDREDANRTRFADEVAAARLAGEDAKDDKDKDREKKGKDGKDGGKPGGGFGAG